MTGTSPVCAATLLAAEFARLDDHTPLGTPTLGLGLCGDAGIQLGSPHIASPALAGWTPRLSMKDLQQRNDCCVMPSLRCGPRRHRAYGIIGFWGIPKTPDLQGTRRRRPILTILDV